MQIASYLFDDIMMATYQKGHSVESFFRNFSKPSGTEFVLNLDDFCRAISTLGVEWGSIIQKVTEFFNALDISSHMGQLRYVSIVDLGEAVLLNASKNVVDFVADSLLALYKILKEKNMLGRIRDLFNFMNSQRDETCDGTEFVRIIKEMIETGATRVLTDNQYEQIAIRYKVKPQSTRVDFSLFIKDLEYCEFGISPAQVWAIHFATNIMKATLVNGFESYEKLFSRYSRLQDTLLYEEFKKVIEELKLIQYHPDSEILEFFTFL